MKWRQKQIKHKVIASIQSKIFRYLAFFQSTIMYITVLEQLRGREFPDFIKSNQQNYTSFWTQTIYVFLNNVTSLCLLSFSFNLWTNTEDQYSEIKRRVTNIWTEVGRRRTHRHISLKEILQLIQIHCVRQDR
jgi:hypothetical protein